MQTTPHISAAEGEIAEAILLPGDPLRAKFIAETFFEDSREVTGVRGMLGFTGTYKEMPVSVMGTGDGDPVRVDLHHRAHPVLRGEASCPCRIVRRPDIGRPRCVGSSLHRAPVPIQR